jgi:HEAT repeat protein
MNMDQEQLPFETVLQRLFLDRTVPISLIYRLSDMNPEELSTFCERWRDQDEERRRVIARHMADISEENFVVDFSPAFLELLADNSEEVRLAALDGLWDTSNLDVVAPIVEIMRSDAAQEVRAAAASALGHFVLLGEWNQIDQSVADQIVEALLEEYMRGDAPEAVQRATLESLGNSAHPRLPELIDEAYRQGSEALQLSAVFAMGRSADRRWTPIIRDELESPEPEMRMEAARAAGGIGDSDTVDRLIELLDDEDLEVQLAVVDALARIGSDQAYEALVAKMEDPDASALYEALEEALDEIEWLGGDIDLTMFEWDEDEPEA